MYTDPSLVTIKTYQKVLCLTYQGTSYIVLLYQLSVVDYVVGNHISPKLGEWNLIAQAWIVVQFQPLATCN